MGLTAAVIRAFSAGAAWSVQLPGASPPGWYEPAPSAPHASVASTAVPGTRKATAKLALMGLPRQAGMNGRLQRSVRRKCATQELDPGDVRIIRMNRNRRPGPARRPPAEDDSIPNPGVESSFRRAKRRDGRRCTDERVPVLQVGATRTAPARWAMGRLAHLRHLTVESSARQ